MPQVSIRQAGGFVTPIDFRHDGDHDVLKIAVDPGLYILIFPITALGEGVPPIVNLSLSEKDILDVKVATPPEPATTPFRYW